MSHIRDRINRKLDTLTDERLYQVLDYVEFLESKYAVKQTAPNALQRFADGVEDTLRAGRISASTIGEAMGLLNRAVGVLGGVAAAGKTVATDLASAASRVGSAVTDVASTAAGSVAGAGGANGGAGPASAPGAAPAPAPGAAPAAAPVSAPAPAPPSTPPSTPSAGSSGPAA